MRILITGGLGFVGRHFANHFLKAGAEVTVVDSMVSESAKELLPHDNLIVHRADFRDWAREQVNETGTKPYDYAMHLAAIIGGRFKIERFPLIVADDLSIDAAFWQWVYVSRPGKVINFSSSAVYPVEYQGMKGHRLLEERMVDFNLIGKPDLTYGWAKLTSEYLGRVAYEKYDIKSVVYRPFSGYGEDQADSYPFPSLMEHVKKAKDGGFVPVWGTGEQMRDFIHIDDVVRGVTGTMDLIDDATPLNLSSGVYTSFKDLIHMAAKVLKKEVTILPKHTMPQGVFARAGDRHRQDAYGIKLKVSLEEGITRYVNA